jgi:hypothetical protein
MDLIKKICSDSLIRQEMKTTVTERYGKQRSVLTLPSINSKPGNGFAGLMRFGGAMLLAVLLSGLMLGLLPAPLLAQPAPLSPPQLDPLVSRIALYPDPLLAQVLTASTYWNEIPDAAAWANQHSYLTGDPLARAIQEDQLPWDPSILALLPFPSVLNMMASDPGWTQQLGNAVLAEYPAVMDAVQRMRQQAMSYGYLRPNGYVNVVNSGGYIEILPVRPGLLYVPEYNPVVVFARPRPGFAIGAAIRFGPGITIGAGFAPFGWASPAIVWPSHQIIIAGHPWARTWVNRQEYVHPYPGTRMAGPRIERHDLREHREEGRHEERDRR